MVAHLIVLEESSVSFFRAPHAIGAPINFHERARGVLLAIDYKKSNNNSLILCVLRAYVQQQWIVRMNHVVCGELTFVCDEPCRL